MEQEETRFTQLMRAHVAAARDRMGISVNDLAAEMGCTTQVIHNARKTARGVGPESLQAFVRVARIDESTADELIYEWLKDRLRMSAYGGATAPLFDFIEVEIDADRLSRLRRKMVGTYLRAKA